MTLNQTKSALLLTALNAGAGVDDTLFKWMKEDTASLSNNEYDTIRNSFISWKDAYDTDVLYVTLANGSTQQLSGISQFPVPPHR